MARGRVVNFAICYRARPRKRKRWMVWFEESGKRYTGRRVLPEWFTTDTEAVAAVRRRWAAKRGGFQYPL
jgi:hypothetical protein